MPISKAGLLRTDGLSSAPKEQTYVPLYSVLFYYGKDNEFTSGTLNLDNYRNYQEIYFPNITIYNADGTPSLLKCDPLVTCINADANWNSNTGVCFAPTTTLPNTGATLFESHTHNPTTLVRTNVYNALGAAPGEQTGPQSYIEQKGSYTHFHTANNIAAGLRGVQYGRYDGFANRVAGINAVAVKPILRDPQLVTNLNEVYNEKKLTYLPKNIVVFGNNLPSNAYSRSDDYHSNTATGKVLPLICKSDNVGALLIANSLTFSITSSTVTNHNHSGVMPSQKRKSKKSGQLGYIVNDAGVHNHAVTYTSNVATRSKILKGWITTQNNTPIANGVIIGYSIGLNTLYQGIYSNSEVLPVNWHFCDGNNGTPDLRGYFIYANFDAANNCHDTVFSSSNTLTISSISMAANGNHSHLGPLTGQEVGSGTPTDIGSHSYEDALNHTHAISTASTFKYNITDTQDVTNIIAGQSYSYVPPRVQLAFIMYNENIV
jgi:hypothetical protein